MNQLQIQIRRVNTLLDRLHVRPSCQTSNIAEKVYRVDDSVVTPEHEEAARRYRELAFNLRNKVN